MYLVAWPRLNLQHCNFRLVPDIDYLRTNTTRSTFSGWTLLHKPKKLSLHASSGQNSIVFLSCHTCHLPIVLKEHNSSTADWYSKVMQGHKNKISSFLHLNLETTDQTEREWSFLLAPWRIGKKRNTSNLGWAFIPRWYSKTVKVMVQSWRVLMILTLVHRWSNFAIKLHILWFAKFQPFQLNGCFRCLSRFYLTGGVCYLK